MPWACPTLAAPRLAVLVLVLASSVQVAGAEEARVTPVVVALDASRSLRPEDVAQASRDLARALERLPGDTPSGLMVFADEARWAAPLGTALAEIPAALAAVEPTGRFTLLHDALFLAARDLSGGGVLLLVTDGRDENSATTLEDVAGRCEDNGVRVITIGLGRRVDDRTLRRLALLTRGEYLGSLDDVEPAAVEVAVMAAASGLEAERATAQVTPAPAPRVAEPPPPQVAAPRARAESPIPWRWVGFGLLLLAGLAALALRRGDSAGGPPKAYCDRCGSEIETEGEPCRACELRDLKPVLLDRPVALPSETAEISLDDALKPEPGSLEKTRVLVDRSLLTIKEPDEPLRSVVLRMDKAFGVGRDPESNTLVIADASLSARHFKIVPRDGRFYLVDLGSTNGTFVNKRRVEVHELETGDVVHAGQAEFEYRRYEDSLN